MSSDTEKEKWDDLAKHLPREYIRPLLVMAQLSLATSIVLPFITSFTKLTPPLFTSVSWIVSFLGIIASVVVYIYRPSKEKQTRPPVRLIAWSAGVLFLALVTYPIMIDWTTVRDPQQGERFQIGFGRETWSLTPEGERIKAFDPSGTPTHWLLLKGAFNSDGIATLWAPWSIYAAGIVMILLYLTLFLSFTLLWMILAMALYQLQAAEPVAKPGDDTADASPKPKSPEEPPPQVS